MRCLQKAQKQLLPLRSTLLVGSCVCLQSRQCSDRQVCAEPVRTAPLVPLSGHVGPRVLVTQVQTRQVDRLAAVSFDRGRGRPGCEHPLEDVGELQVSLGGLLGRGRLLRGERQEEEEDEPDHVDVGEPAESWGERHAHDGRHSFRQQPV